MKLGALCRMIKIEHSVFALPFAYIGMVLAAGGWPGLVPFVLITVAMVAIRTYAMTFNRLADLEFDSLNPRTKDRPLVTGEISTRDAKIFLFITGLIFILACAGLNWLCLALSPIPLLVGAFYSYTKRFTPLCHFVLGSVLGLAPVASWLGVTPEFTVTAALFFFGVTFWVAGFDILYACQDAEFDREQGLNSMPANLGIPTALALSTFCHICTAIFFGLAGANAGLGWGYWIVWAPVAIALIWEHSLISADDMSRVNMAFFTVNGVIGVSLFLGVLMGLWF
ncbi:4-hydroxybenzoate octaprenyltransferase [Desulfovibrio ferrophilus]|uniref:4-hydroxybenzoate polyprenyltransferase n=1 Tax=Desulfovibrio ferrophilus TaxID=241368 RepID=A0A2Z6B2D2_9BACT|nr:4-hydroxybenzoate octaprenyltransferase [Desulfovibrio ferrophilus]BBD09677.1 4-hydroxybenzoate polyprenyltransferase [Desulfovibrio ferrophilus]